ncbi:leucine-rich repeat-containing protein 41 [Alligator mississippiensis]|uniref:Leucine-rich repeat-containing protein 41 n=1 Tax=Alligator mississippiensis TaxID=8496 RepID=A0A151NGB5_ALLMI|nr:leucine-rich repeat-containing protein 41 [Alligator mississippiensis]
MGALESEVWALPAHILHGLLPLLNIYYLERAEDAAASKGLSTQPIWRKLWNDVMKTRPPKSEHITCWRKKFLETFFSNILHGVLDVSSDQRLNDDRFSPLLHSSQHVTQLTILNMLQGVTELTAERNQRVVENLAGCLKTLKFRHLLSSDLSIRHSLSLLLHRLIHHGAVDQVSLYSWPVPDTVLLVLILSMSAGFWHPKSLVLSYNGLGANIFCILSGLRALSRHNDRRLHVVRVSDVFSHVPSVELVHCILSAFPWLRTLSVSFDLKHHLEGSRPEGSLSSLEEIPESCLEQLEIRFPREPLQTALLLPVLKASRSLQQLSLDSAALPCPQEFRLLLQALKERNPDLKKLSFHDVNLADHQEEVLLLLQDPILQEITFSFCRLFESSTAEFLSEIINVVKRNSSLKSLKLPGNRLGNHRLVALADIFSEDSSSSICQLDVSSNCIKPDGLLEFTKKLESHLLQRGEQAKFTHLRLFQNWLDQDVATAQEALQRLRAVCSVVSDTWDSSQAFADYISVM